ncbi:MAG: protein of unknown function DUF990, partial [uncultured Chloroflexia bacterium]
EPIQADVELLSHRRDERAPVSRQLLYAGTAIVGRAGNRPDRSVSRLRAYHGAAWLVAARAAGGDGRACADGGRDPRDDPAEHGALDGRCAGGYARLCSDQAGRFADHGERARDPHLADGRYRDGTGPAIGGRLPAPGVAQHKRGARLRGGAAAGRDHDLQLLADADDRRLLDRAYGAGCRAVPGGVSGRAVAGRDLSRLAANRPDLFGADRLRRHGACRGADRPADVANADGRRAAVAYADGCGAHCMAHGAATLLRRVCL